MREITLYAIMEEEVRGQLNILAVYLPDEQLGGQMAPFPVVLQKKELVEEVFNNLSPEQKRYNARIVTFKSVAGV